jgi:hypothetical protein
VLAGRAGPSDLLAPTAETRRELSTAADDCASSRPGASRIQPPGRPLIAREAGVRGGLGRSLRARPLYEAPQHRDGAGTQTRFLSGRAKEGEDREDAPVSLRGCAEIEFEEDLGDVGLDGLAREKQSLGDRAVGMAFGDEP